MLDYGYKKYNSMKPVGNCVLIEKMTENELRKSHGLFIPQVKKLENNKIGVGKVLDLSKTAEEKTGVKPGDYVLYDYYSAFNDQSINILTNYENIIMIVSKKEADEFLNGTL